MMPMTCTTTRTGLSLFPFAGKLYDNIRVTQPDLMKYVVVDRSPTSNEKWGLIHDLHYFRSSIDLLLPSAKLATYLRRQANFVLNRACQRNRNEMCIN